MSVHARIFRNSYRDSVELMRIAAECEALPGISRAGLVMATPANREVLATAGLLTDAIDAAGPNDLVVAVSADDETQANAALDRAGERLAGTGDGSRAGRSSGGADGSDARPVPQTLADGVAELSGADVALVSTPGTYATAEALKALKRGLNVFLFSDNVPIEDEIALKTLAVDRGLLLMGPDCGTAILDGVPLGFANAVRRGSIGLVGASGTGLQQVSSLIDRYGGGVSQAIGVGGRDLDSRVGGRMMLAALARLDADPATRVIVLISKPPAEAVARAVLQAAAGSRTPVVVNFLGGDPAVVREHGLVPAATFEAAAAAAVALAKASPPPVFDAAREASLAAADPAVQRAIAALAPGQWRIRGLFAGGSLAGEAKLVLASMLGADAAHDHEILDLGDDEFTVGRPHPMIDPRLRNERILAAGADPETAVILLDVVLGYGSHPDPAGALVASIEAAVGAAAAAGRHIAVVASVCGTDADSQGRTAQEATLAKAGVILGASNAQAARMAAAIAAGATRTVPRPADEAELGGARQAASTPPVAGGAGGLG